MNIAACIRISFFTLLSLSTLSPTTTYTADQLTPEQQQEQLFAQQEYQEYQQILQKMVSQKLEEYRAIDRVIEDLLLLVDNSSTARIGKKRELRHNAIALRDFIRTITQEAFVQIDASSLHLLNYLSAEIMKHLIKSLDNHFTSLPAFELDNIAKRHTARNVGLDELKAGFAKNKKLLKELDDKANSAGLRWYNKAYRKFDKYVIQPGEKYSLFSRARKIFALGVLYKYLWFHTESSSSFLDPVARLFKYNSFRDFIGWSPKILSGNTLDPKHEPIFENGKVIRNAAKPLNWLGNTEYMFIQGGLGYLPLGVALFWYLKSELSPESTATTGYLAKKLLKFHNFMKGGTFFQHFEKPDDKYAVNPRITFNEIIGMNHAKETLSFIVKYMENPEQYDRGKLAPEKGYLLTGPTRAGKTYMVEGLAGEIKEMYKRKGKRPEDFNFFVLNATFVLQEGIKNLVDRAKALSPCILFIDEIDLLGLQRAGGNPAVLSEFLTAMSGCLEQDPDKVVIIVAATNKPENLDVALRQRGRLGKEIRFEYPTFDERAEFFVRRISKLANINNFDIEKLARETEGKSFEDINALIRNAFQRGILHHEALTQELLESSMDEEVRNIIMNENSMSDIEKKIVAVHQAGQALATLLLGHEQLAKVTIKPYLANIKEENLYDQFYKHEGQQQKKIKYGKIYTFHAHDTKNVNTFGQKIALCKQMIAGFVAEKIIYGSCGYGNHPEYGQQALDIASSVIAEGIDIHSPHFPPDLKSKYYEKALTLMKQCELEVRELLEKHKEALEKLAQALIEQQTLSGKEVIEITGVQQAKA